MSSLRREALRWYKILQRTKNEVFSGDFRTISAARQRIREEFVKNKDIKDEKQIKEKIQIAKDVDVELRRSVVQAVRKQPTLFGKSCVTVGGRWPNIRPAVLTMSFIAFASFTEARITPDTRKMDNVMFDPDAELPPPRSKKCSDKKS
ncbi:uncharacterized protein LOC1270200 isoform X1 [Anopheles gambiae]|uniref:uncharacterized protein LOC1270200 isoform X1 n=1 Tax=Anopheles gambiae TaxID=7165 RepID=UPI002AC97F3B|nr:uncharacterized protein LOC1270200 isoform X1 [Anopheles gambiae]